MKRLAFSMFGLVLFGCEQVQEQRELSYVVTRETIVIDIPAEGELEAKTATPISIPAGVFEPQQLAWMVEENQLVKKGQVIARLDSTKYVYQTQQQKFEQQQVSLEKDVKKETLEKEATDISSDNSLIKKELHIADKYTIEDLRLFSKNEIIDKMKNKDYLEARLNNNEWRWGSYQNKSSTEMELLTLQQQEIEAKMNMYQSSLDKMEITAPHDGVFVLTKNWRGEKTQVGQLIFPGGKFATLPDLTVMQANLFVLENESANIKAGLPVALYLDAYPQHEFTGEVLSVEPVAKVRDKENPVKYFQVKVALDKTDMEKMRPGDQLKARVVLVREQNAIAIPSTAIYEQEGEHFVDVLEDGSWRGKKIKFEIRGSDLTQVLSGLEESDEIAIFPVKSRVL